MKRASAFERRFERLLLGTGMSVMLFVMERRVIKMQRDSKPRAGREVHSP